MTHTGISKEVLVLRYARASLALRLLVRLADDAGGRLKM